MSRRNGENSKLFPGQLKVLVTLPLTSSGRLERVAKPALIKCYVMIPFTFTLICL